MTEKLSIEITKHSNKDIRIIVKHNNKEYFGFAFREAFNDVVDAVDFIGNQMFNSKMFLKEI